MARVNIFHKAAIFHVRSLVLLRLYPDDKTFQMSPIHPKGDVIIMVPEIYYRKYTTQEFVILCSRTTYGTKQTPNSTISQKLWVFLLSRWINRARQSYKSTVIHVFRE